jgi:hypothetical protein
MPDYRTGSTVFAPNGMTAYSSRYAYLVASIHKRSCIQPAVR